MTEKNQTNHIWDREQLIAELSSFEKLLISETNPVLSDMEQSYCRFYGIDKENQIAGVSHYMGYFEAYGFQLAVHLYCPEVSRGTVFLFHGYFDHAGLYGHITEFLLRQNFTVLIYDLPGHGLSSGESVAINHFAQYKAVLEKCLTICKSDLINTTHKLPQPWFAVGQSTGAAVLVDYMFSNRFDNDNTPFQHWVFLAPLLRPSGWKSLVALHSLLGWFLKSWKREFLPNSHDSDFLRFLREEDPLQIRAISVKWVGALRRWIGEVESSVPIYAPVTIVQGPDDGTVDWRHNIPHLKQMLPNANVKVLTRGRHQLVNESPEIREKVFGLMLSGLESSLE